MAALLDPANETLLSVCSIWEMAIKVDLGKLTLRLPLADIVAQQQANGVEILPVKLEHALSVMALPAIHKDPFDRLIVAAANAEAAELVTDDQMIRKYSVRVVW